MRAPRKYSRGKGPSQTRWVPPDEEWLRHQHIGLGKHARAIGYEVGVGHNVVLRWLREARISMSSKGMEPPIELKRYYIDGRSKWRCPGRRWLEHQYLTLKKSARAIGKETGAGGATVRMWLEKVGIPPRGPEEAYALVPVGVSLARRCTKAREVLKEAYIPKVCGLPWPEPKGCGTPKGRIEVHHIDEDRGNNELSNLQYLCSSCHLYLHYELRRRKSDGTSSHK